MSKISIVIKLRPKMCIVLNFMEYLNKLKVQYY